MKVAVCIKQVPVLSRVTFDYETKTIVREGVPLEVNSYDLLAVDRAAKLKEQTNTDVLAITMGPPQASDALVQCLAMGADRGILLTDRLMAGSDTLATARTLAMALEQEACDLIFCGRHSTDAETGQVGPELAELMGLPHVSNVYKLDYDPGNNSVLVERETDDGHEVVRCPLPAVICVAEGIMPERFPSRADMEAGREKSIVEVGADALSPHPELFGAAGSPTWVSDIQIIESSRLAEVVEDEDRDAAVRRVADAFAQREAPEAECALTGLHRYPGKQDESIWVVVETPSTGLRNSTYQLLGKACQLSQRTSSEVAAIVVGLGSEETFRALAAYGANRVIALDDSEVGHPTSNSYVDSLAGLVLDRQPYAVLLQADANGRDIASRMAARLGLGLTGDCVDLEINEQMELVQMKPALGGNVIAPIYSKTKPYLTTLRPGLLTPIEPDWSADAFVEHMTAARGLDPDVELVERHLNVDVQGVELESARIVVGVGKGVGPENVPAVAKLAESIGASIACTRDVADVGWMPRQTQVGLTGKAIAPELYIAVGIRGDFNHMVGVQKAGTIIAINNNNNARRTPILNSADYTIIGDWQEYLEPLLEALRPHLG
jgi:electron transfer flavoprotein alpha subunit